MQSRIELSAAPGELHCELRSSPLGIGSPVPVFSWQSMDTRTAEVESAWQILVASQRDVLVRTAGPPQADLWDSGVVAGSSRGIQVPYEGLPLVSRQQAWWTVRTFDSDGLSSGYAEPACFELGLLSNLDWCGDWLEVPWQGSATDQGGTAVLVRDFEVPELPQQARLYLAVLGRASIELNGRAVDAAVGDTDAADPALRRRYTTLDVTHHLIPGLNRLGVLLSDGACCGNRLLPASREGFAAAPSLLAQLEWRDALGRIQRVVSDRAWALFRSPILASDPVQGEAVDLRRWNPGWSVPDVALTWEPASLVVQPRSAVPLVADASFALDRPPRPHAEVLTLDTLEYLVPEPRAVAPRPQLNGLLIDLGRVRHGRLRIDGRFAQGDRLIVHYAQSRPGLAAAVDSDRFTAAAGDGAVEALSAERSFRYARLAGDVEWRDVTAIHFSSSRQAPRRAATELLVCNQPALAAALAEATQLFTAATEGRPAFTATSARGLDLRPVSWIEPLAGCSTALALFANAAGVRRWVEDARDALQKFGTLPCALPAPGNDPLMASEGRSDLFVQMLWVAYSGFGDAPLVRACLPELEDLVARWQAQSSEGYWADPSWQEERRLPADYVGGARLGVALRTAAALAEQVDAVRAAGRFQRFAEELRRGFRQRYLTARGALLFQSADACLFAVAAGYLNASERVEAIDTLVAALLPVVRTGAPLPVLPELYATLFEQLFAQGHADLAYQLLPALCATHVSERGVAGADAVLTTDAREVLTWQPAGQLLEVCYSVLLGVALTPPALDVRPSFRDSVWQPRPPRPVFAAASAGATLTRLTARLQTTSGVLDVGWHLEGATLRCLSSLAGDMALQLRLPNGQSLRQSAGEHEFTVDLDAEEDGIPVLVDAVRARGYGRAPSHR